MTLLGPMKAYPTRKDFLPTIWRWFIRVFGPFEWSSGNTTPLTQAKHQNTLSGLWEVHQRPCHLSLAFSRPPLISMDTLRQRAEHMLGPTTTQTPYKNHHRVFQLVKQKSPKRTIPMYQSPLTVLSCCRCLQQLHLPHIQVTNHTMLQSPYLSSIHLRVVVTRVYAFMLPKMEEPNI